MGKGSEDWGAVFSNKGFQVSIFVGWFAGFSDAAVSGHEDCLPTSCSAVKNSEKHFWPTGI